MNPRPLLAAAAFLLAEGGCTLLFEPDPAEGPPAACRDFGPFGEAEEIFPGEHEDILGTLVDDPTMSTDLLELYFATNTDLWRSTRGSPDAPWGLPEQVTELSSNDSESDPVLSADGTSLWFCSTRGGGGRHEIYEARRNGPGDTWRDVRAYPELNISGNNCPGWVSRDGKTLLFRAGPLNAFVLHVARRDDPDGDFDEPIPLAGIADDPEVTTATAPFYLECAGELWLDANRANFRGIHYASWNPAEDEVGPLFQAQVVEGPSGRAGDPWLSPDGTLLLFTANHPTGERIYQTTRSAR